MHVMRRTIEAVGAALLVLANIANAADATSGEAASKVAAQFHAALEAGNADGASALLSATALIFESGHAETRDEYISHHLAADIAFAKATQRTVKSKQQQCDESMCVLMQSSETTGTFKGKNVRSLSKETMVLRREGDAWKILHVHWSSHK